MRGAQRKLIEDLWPTRAEGLPFKTPQDALVLASIVEKETGKADERAHVAAVFVNRLRKGMRLQSDPTIIYGITKGQGKLDRPLSRSDIREATDFNTYQINGLPPTPIANPGRASIKAVLNPIATDDLYFVADGTGGHVFAKTLAQHNANVRKWRSWLRTQREQRNWKKKQKTAVLQLPNRLKRMRRNQTLWNSMSRCFVLSLLPGAVCQSPKTGRNGNEAGLQHPCMAYGPGCR